MGLPPKGLFLERHWAEDTTTTRSIVVMGLYEEIPIPLFQASGDDSRLLVQITGDLLAITAEYDRKNWFT